MDHAKGSVLRSTPPALDLRGGRAPLLLFLAALAVRIAFAALEPPTRPVGDEITWIAAASDFSNPEVRFDPLRAPLIVYPPLHPLLVALARELGGWNGVKLVQCLLGAALVPCAFLVGRRAFGRKVGLLAAAAVAFYPELVWQSAHFWSEPLFMALLWGAMAWLLTADTSAAKAHAALAGVLLGLAALTRDPALFFAPIAALWLLGGRARRRWRLAAVFLVSTLFVVLPWTIRNWVRFDTLVPVSVMGARTFWEANARQHAEVIDAYASVEQAQGPIAAYRHAWREGLIAVRARQPWWIFQQLRDQLPQFWTPNNLLVIHLERRAYGSVPVWAAWSVLLLTALPHVLATGAFLLGIAVLPINRARLLLLLFLAYYQLLHVVTLGHPRLRLPVLPAVFVFASALLVPAPESRPRWTPLRTAAAVLLLLAFALCIARDLPAIFREPLFGLS